MHSTLLRSLPCRSLLYVLVSTLGATPLRGQDPPQKPAEPTATPVNPPKPTDPPKQAEPGKSDHQGSAAKSNTPAPTEAEKQKEAAKDPKVARDVSQFNLGEDSLAIDGFDPVAYFPEGGGKPTRGKDSITFRYRGVVYRFKDEANKERFVADPSKYEPLYGGWCAYGCAKQDKVEIDPESFLIEDGHLMLFYDGFLADTRAKWLDQGSKELKPKADSFWTKVLSAKHG